MGKLTTHVLDTAHGCPAAAMQVTLLRLDAAGATTLKTITLNADGRADAPLLEGDALLRGRYRLVFSVAPYFRARGTVLPEPPFVDDVPPTPRRTITCRCSSARGATAPTAAAEARHAACIDPGAGAD